jgi:hypothetical protein
MPASFSSTRREAGNSKRAKLTGGMRDEKIVEKGVGTG